MAVFSHNREANFHYEVLEKTEAGLELRGFEVKAVKQGKMNLRGAHVTIRGAEAYLLGASIAPYQPGNTPENYEPDRARRLLLTHQELKRLAEATSRQGLTIVPLSVYNKGRFLKLEIGLARGKKRYDKRAAIQKRDTDREIRRTLKRG